MRIAGDALSGLIAWTRRPPWREELDAVLGEHLRDACEAVGVGTFDELRALVGDHGFQNLWGCALEDLFTRPTEAGNVVDDYLKRRGWKEPSLTKEYMLALRNSVMSLYEVSDIRAGESFLARDLVRGGELVLVHERTATRTLKPWDRLGLRIVSVRGQAIMSGAVLPLERAAADDLLSELRQLLAAAPEVVGAALDEAGAKAPAETLAELAAAIGLRSAAPIFTAAWLQHTLGQIRNPRLPTLLNSDGEEIVFITLRYAMVKGKRTSQLRATLDALPDLAPASATFWNWLQALGARRSTSQSAMQGLQTTTTMSDGRNVLGTLELGNRALRVEVSSPSRAELIQALLAGPLAGLVDAPRIEQQTQEQMLARQDKRPRAERVGGLSAEEERAIIHRTMDDRYREALDKPIPMLGNVSPRQAARSPAGRQKVVSWLKYLENRTHTASRRDDGDPMAEYDFGWMWQELGVADRRQ